MPDLFSVFFSVCLKTPTPQNRHGQRIHSEYLFQIAVILIDVFKICRQNLPQNLCAHCPLYKRF